MATIKRLGLQLRIVHVYVTLVATAILVLTGGSASRQGPIEARSRAGCAADANPVRCENMLPGDGDWGISGSGSSSIQGFATDMSVDYGGTIDFKIATDAASYVIDIYRMGYYGGAGARKVASIAPSAALPQVQPVCESDAALGLVDCGNWAISASWPVPLNAVSGIYFAVLKRTDGTAGASHIYFVVRDDTRAADVIFQTSDTTWQAYNTYGGASTYCAPSGVGFSNAGTAYGCLNRGVKVSYNRPFDTRDHDPQSFLFNAEYPMVRFLEANGFNVKYWSGVDTDRRGADLVGPAKPKIFVSTGHDEYWSGAQRSHVENARNAGVNLAFFSGNEIYWKHRFEPSIVDGMNHRTMVVYKETLAGTKIDPAVDPATNTPIWTGTWRDNRFSPPADGGRPENALLGTIWTVNCCTATIQVPVAYKNLRLWQNTRIPEMTSGVANLGSETLGYEWGEALENGHQPAGLIRLSSTTVEGMEKIIDFGATVGVGTATHSLTMYRHNSGAIVFSASTVQWAWGLDGQHDRGGPASHVPDQAMQQATVTLFADMGVQPSTLQIGADPARPLVTMTPTADIFAPTSTITSPAQGSPVESGDRINVTGTATDADGVVAGVEVSVDGGVTWRKANGTTAWTFEWSPGALGNATVRSRAVDDSGNLEIPSAGVTVSVETGTCPCESLFKPSTVPDNPGFPDNSAYELGVKFVSDIDGFITGIRYYKSLNNSGTHTGSLWSLAGDRLATATFTNETATGWQEVLFETPVAITAGTVYVASYHTNVGHYAVTPNYFASVGVHSPPLHAPPATEVGGNGVFAAGASAYPSSTFNAANYWVDVVFSTSNSDVTPPEITNVVQTTIDGSKVEITWDTDELATSKIEYSTSVNYPPDETSTISSSAFVRKHKIAIGGLQPNTTYYYRVISTDGPGNAATVEPPTFTLPGPTLRDTAEADFLAGSGIDTYVSGKGDGELSLAPAIGQEFSGTSMPPGWLATPWGIGGFATVGGGVLRVDGSRVGTCTGDPCIEQAIYTAGRSIEFDAIFTGDAFQHAGLAVTLGSASESWAIFSTLFGGNLYARTNTGAASQDILLGGTLLGAMHRYRIDWKHDGTVDYYVDGTFVASSSLVVPGPMRPVAASDFSVFGGNIIVNWLHMTPYGPAGTFHSRVFDAQSVVGWNSIQWQTSLPAGTTASIKVRTGDTPIPDETWTAFVPIAAPGPLVNLQSRYVQYEASLTTADGAVTPLLEDIIISTSHAPVAVDDFFRIGENTSRTFLSSGPGSLVFNDTDGDVNDVLRVKSVGAASNGQVVLNGDGSVTYTPNANYSGPDSFPYVVTDGMMISSATVTLDVTSVNNAPEANPDFYNTDEDTALMVNAANGILFNDQDAEGDILRAVLVSPPSFAASFSLNANGAFTYIPVASFAGPDHFSYKANDGELDSAVVTVQILMNQVNDPPIAEPDAFTAVLNQALQVSAPGVLGNDHDVEVESAAPLSAELVSTTSNGTLTFNPDGSFEYTPNADYLGLDTFTYRARDSFNAAGNVTTVTLTVALKAVAATVASGSTVTTGNTVSAEDPLQSAVTTPTNALIAIAQGVISDSQSPSGYTFLNQQVNIAVINPDGTEVFAPPQTPLAFTFTIDASLIPPGQNEQTFEVFRNGVLVPNCPGATSIPASNLDPCVSERVSNAPAFDSIRLTILTTHASRWNMGVSTSELGELTARNDGPFTTNRDVPLVIAAPGVLGNDFGTGTIEAEVFGTPEGGTLTLARSGAFTFTPAPGFCGPASFAYTAGIGAERSAPATVSITINCDPVAENDATTVLEDSGETMIAVLTNDSDPDPGQTLRIDSVTQGAHGAVVASPDGMWLTYAPEPNFFGDDSFTYSVRDSLGSLATGTVHVTVTPVNDAPSFVKGVNVSTGEDATAQTVAAWATAISAGPGEGDALTFVVTSDNASLFAVTPQVSADGTLTYTPAPDSFGVANVSVTLTDNGGTADGGVDTSATDSFTITVGPVNDPPSFVKGADQSLLEDTGSQTVAQWATQISAGPGEGDQSVHFLVAADNPSLFSVLPAVDPTGTLTYDPAPNAVGTATVTVHAQDNGGTAIGGLDTSAAQAFTITLNLVNDPPTFTKGLDQTVVEDSAAQSVVDWASNMSPGPADESQQVVEFVVAADRPELFTTQPAVAPNGTLTFAAASDAYGVATISVRLRDDGGTLNGGNDTSAPQLFTITILPVNDVPSFTKGGDQTTFASAGTQTVAGWATDMTAGPNETGQALSFTVTNSNNGLFSVQPAVAANGTLTYAPAGVAGSATVTVVLGDNGGTANGGVDTTAPQTFAITIVPTPTSTTVTSSNQQSLAGLSITLTATVSPAAAGGIPTGAVTFRRGTTPIGTVALVDGVATLNTASLPVGSHSITAAYGGSGAFAPSTSAQLTQTITASATLNVKFQVQALQDNTSRPKVAKVPVPNALVKVFATADGCTGAIWRSIRPKKWGVIFDGEDGLGGVDGCQALTVGTYEAVGTTDVNGDVSIIVPALSANFSNQYLVIGRATNFDYVKTATSSDPLYSQHAVVHVSSGSSKKVPLSMLATFNGKIVPGKQVEFFGSYLNLIEPEYVDWTEDQEQYPFVMEAEGDWNVTTSVAPPEGFIPDASSLNAVAADTTTAVQFTLTDVASDWTETQVQHAITHNGATTQQVSTVPMYDRKPTRARPDFGKMMHDTSGLIIDVMTNDRYAHQNGPISIVSSTPALNGVATLSEDGLHFTYTPAPGFSGTDTFEYTITDAVGTRSTALVTISVLATPEVRVRDDVFAEGHEGTVPAMVAIVLSNQSVEPVTVRYTTADKSAVAGADYIAASGELTFTPGITRIDVPVGIVGELLAEANEAFEVQLSGVTGGILTATSNGNIVIRDDDPPDIVIEPTATVVEGNVGSKNVAVTVTMSQADAENVNVDFVTVDGTAVAGSDYLHQALTVTFYPGQKQHTLFIPILGDTDGELDETFTIELRNALNGVIVNSTTLVTITNDDITTLVTTTAADFAVGTRSDVYIADSANGELILAPTLATEFPADALPTGWSTTPVADGGSVTVANGAMSVDGSAVITTPELFGYGKVLEVHATFSGAPNQSIGFGVDETLGAPMAMWMINERRQMVVRTVRGAKFVESEIFGLDWLNVPHEYEVRWNAGNAQYYVDGTLMASHTQMGWSATQMRPVIIDGTTGDKPMTINWMRMSPYASEGSYTSQVFDAGLVVDWTKLTVARTLVNGTAVSLMYRSGNTPVPDATWTAFAAPGTGGALVGVSGRYLQFEVRLSTTAPGRTPTVKDVTVVYKPQ